MTKNTIIIATIPGVWQFIW